MHLELRYRSDIDLSQPAMQVEIRNHIARCPRDYPHGCERVITLAGVEHCLMYVVQDDVVDEHRPASNRRRRRARPEMKCSRHGPEDGL